MSLLACQNPVGIFWDIENCQVPADKNALQIVQKLREKFCPFGKEVEFVCVCDVNKERGYIIDKLNAAQITIVHVASVSKNAADEKLKSYLRKFSNTYRAPGLVVLITSDVNFAPELSDLRYRCGFSISLIHNRHVSDALLVIAHQTYIWSRDILNLISTTVQSAQSETSASLYDVIVYDLPPTFDKNRVRERLHRLSSNCGGRVLSVNCQSRTAFVRFSTFELANRACTRIQNEDVFGYKIKARLSYDRTSAVFSSTFPFKQEPTVGSQADTNFRIERISISRTDNNRNTTANNFPNQNWSRVTVKAVSQHPANDSTRHEMVNKQNPSVFIDNGVASSSSAAAVQKFGVKPPPTSLAEAGRILKKYLNDAGLIKADDWPPLTASDDVDQRMNKTMALCLSSKFGACLVNGAASRTTVDVRVDNLDSTVSIRCLKQNLYSIFSAVVRVLHITIVPQSTGVWFALVQVACKYDALQAVRTLDKIKLGQKFINVSALSPSNSPSPDSELKKEACSILKSLQSNNLPLETFQQVLQERLGRPVATHEIKNLGDVIEVAVNGRTKDVECRLIECDTLNFTTGCIGSRASSNQASSHKKYPQHSALCGSGGTVDQILSRKFGHRNGRRSQRCFCAKPPIDRKDTDLMPRLLCCLFRDQLITVLVREPDQSMLLSDLGDRYQRLFGTPLNWNAFGYDGPAEALADMEGAIEKSTDESLGECVIKLRDTLLYQATVEEILHLFLYQPDKELTLREFQNEFRDVFGFGLPLNALNSSLTDVLEVFECRNRIIGVRLTPIQRFALRVRRLLLNNVNGSLLLGELDRIYRLTYGESIRSQSFGFSNVAGLLRAASHVLYMKGRGQSLSVCINRNFLGFELKKRPNSLTNSTVACRAVDADVRVAANARCQPLALSNASAVATLNVAEQSMPLASSTPRRVDLPAAARLPEHEVIYNVNEAKSPQRIYVLEPVDNFITRGDSVDESKNAKDDDVFPRSDDKLEQFPKPNTHCTVDSVSVNINKIDSSSSNSAKIDNFDQSSTSVTTATNQSSLNKSTSSSGDIGRRCRLAARFSLISNS